jgi:hypothetical protein
MTMYVNYNCNPKNARVGDCVIRALAKTLDQSWEETYIQLCLYGLIKSDIPSANHVWGAYLKDKGFKRHILPNECPDCYNVKDFAKEYDRGRYVLAISGHVVAVQDGNYYDSFDSGDMTPIYYWKQED